MDGIGHDITKALLNAATASGRSPQDVQRMVEGEVALDPCVLEGRRPVAESIGGVIVATASPTFVDHRGQTVPCIRCGGTTYEADDTRSRSCRPCPGHAMWAAAERVTAARIPGRYIDARTTHVAEAIEAVNTWKRGAQGLWLWGDTGAGKSHAAARSLRALTTAKGAHGRWVDVTELLDQVRGSYRGDDVSESQILRTLSAVPVLVIDELGVQQGTRRMEFEATVIGALVQRRYSSGGLTTWVTSNLSPEQLSAAHDWQMDRTVSRLCEMTRQVHVRGADRRRVGSRPSDE